MARLNIVLSSWLIGVASGAGMVLIAILVTPPTWAMSLIGVIVGGVSFTMARLIAEWIENR